MDDIKFKNIYKMFNEMEKSHHYNHNKAFHVISDSMDKDESQLSDKENMEKQLDCLTKMQIEASFIMVGRIKKNLLLCYLYIFVIFFIAAMTIYSIILRGYFTTAINLVFLGIDIVYFKKTANQRENLKNDLLEHNKAIFYPETGLPHENK